MKKGKFMLIVGTAAWCATATFGSNPLPEDSMDAVRTMLRFAHANPRDTFTLDAVYVEPNFSMPEVSVGSLSASVVHPREVFRAAIDHAAAAMILLHNHPSGDPTPSREDIAVTERLVKAGKIMDIPVLDHVVLGRDRFISLKEKGLLQG